jgi:hypothetical protein
MNARTLFLSRLIGLLLIVAALAMFLRGQDFADTVMMLLRDAPLMFVIGVFTVAAGLAMVLAHNLWSGSAATVIVTLIGWLSVIKGIFFLSLTPDAETAVFLQGLHYQRYFHVYAAVALALGVYLCYCGFRKPAM